MNPTLVKLTFAARCRLSTDCLPAAPYRVQLEALHAAMLAEIERTANTALTPESLVACPFCGAAAGYTLADGSTYRWWTVTCAACGGELGECAADRTLPAGAPKPKRWRWADEHWNLCGAHHAALVADASRYRWLKQNSLLGIDKWGRGYSLRLRPGVAPDSLEDLDFSIDRAIREQQAISDVQIGSGSGSGSG
jgi:hypothetical protein